MESDIDAAARFEVNQFMFECAGSIIGLSLTDHQKHTLFHRFKKVLEDAEYKINRARTPPHGHIIDDAGVVRKVMHVSKYPGVSFLTIHSEAADAEKGGKA